MMSVADLSRKSWKIMAGGLILLALMGLSACAPAAAAEPTAVLAPATETSAPADTLAPTLPPPTQTALPSLTATFTETALPTVTLTPSADYAAIEIKGLTNNANGVDVVAVIPGISGAYDLQLGGIPYACATDAGYPDRLFCKGLSKPALDTDISVVLTASADSQVVYSGRITIPSGMFATQVPDYYTDNYCAQRGQNVSCETECRIAPDGNPCIVATCVDACGAYFAVDSCPYMEMNFSSCSAEQWQQMKARYSIP